MNIGLVGFGISNQAVYEHFKGSHKITVHNEHKIPLPYDASFVFGKDYLNCNEDVIFRSPSVRPDKINAQATVLCEAVYALNNLSATKICITGSDGKTTTSTLIYEILKNKRTYLGGNIGNPLICALDKGYDFIVSELSSFQLMDERAPACDTAIITNVTENHLDYHKDMDEYISAKERILENAKRIVLNYDNPILKRLGKKYKNAEYFSLNTPCEAYVKEGYIFLYGKKLLDVSKIKLKGSFNVLNVLASLIATHPYVDTEPQINAICSFSGVKNRMELIAEKNGIKFYNSSADTTPSRTLATLSHFDEQKCVIILGGSDKNLSYAVLGEPLLRVKASIIFGENKQKIASILNSQNVFLVNNLQEAVALGVSLCQNGDSLLLSPASASFDMFSSYVERGNTFASIVNQLQI